MCLLRSFDGAASLVGICALPDEARLTTPTRNPDIDRLAHDINTKQTKTLASGIDEIMAGLKESIAKPSSSIASDTHALVLVVEHNGCLTNAVCNAICVQDDQVVVSKQMVDAVIGVYQTMFTK